MPLATARRWRSALLLEPGRAASSSREISLTAGCLAKGAGKEAPRPRRCSFQRRGRCARQQGDDSAAAISRRRPREGFLDSIKAAVEQGWTVVVTSDHGHTPFWTMDRKEPRAGDGSASGRGRRRRVRRGPSEDGVPGGPFECLWRVGAFFGTQRRGFHGESVSRRWSFRSDSWAGDRGPRSAIASGLVVFSQGVDVAQPARPERKF